MEMTRFSSIDLVSSEPALAGRICEAFICQSLALEGEPEATAHITDVKLGDVWHRLYFEFHKVFGVKESQFLMKMRRRPAATGELMSAHWPVSSACR
jgi:hypothetical protein